MQLCFVFIEDIEVMSSVSARDVSVNKLDFDVPENIAQNPNDFHTFIIIVNDS